MVKIIVDALTTLFVFLAMFPFIPFLVVWLIGYFMKWGKKEAIRLAMDCTVPFLVFSVSGLYDVIIGTSLNGIYLILFFFLLFTGLIGNAQFRLKGAIDQRKLIRIVWRFAFITLAPLYLLFTFIGVLKQFVS